MRASLSKMAATALLLTATAIAPAALASDNGQVYRVELNKTSILNLPGRASTVLIGNPDIADVTVQALDTLFVVGRGYGETNLIVMDAQGKTMLNVDVQVVNTLSSHGVRLYNARSRQTYSCAPYCQPSPVLGDQPEFISANSGGQEELNPLTALFEGLMGGGETTEVGGSGGSGGLSGAAQGSIDGVADSLAGAN